MIQSGPHGSDGLESFRDPTCGDDVVVLDQGRIRQRHAVVGAPAAAHGVLLQSAQARGGLAGVADTCRRARHGVDPGAGERGDDFHAARSEGVKTLIQTLEKLGVKQYYILIPQCPKSEKWVESPWSAPDHRMSENPTWPMNLLLKLLDSCRQHLDRVDLNRIYITGLSMGGFGTWELAQRIPDRLAAVMPICGGGDSTLAHRLKNLPVWAFHGSKDAVVLPIRTKAMGMVLKKMGAPCQISLFKNEAHGIWNRVYSNKTYVSWLLQQRRNPQGN